MTPQEIADKRLPGPFGLYSYLQHVLIPDTWGRRDNLNPCINDVADGDNCSICWNHAAGREWDTTVVWKQLIWCWGTHYIGAGVFCGDSSADCGDGSFYHRDGLKSKQR